MLILILHYYYYYFTINPLIHTTVKICDDIRSRNKRSERTNQSRKKVNNTLQDSREDLNTFEYRFNMPFFKSKYSDIFISMLFVPNRTLGAVIALQIEHFCIPESTSMSLHLPHFISRVVSSVSS